jgi:NAD(P)H-hydrate repair Nnr-like enzyme with NAD(P)H-hydrate dehydratase domain
MQKTLVCPCGNPGMATAGMGDVLTGCVAALTAQGIQHNLDAWSATILAVYLHALAGDSLAKKGIGPIGMTASELSQEIRTVLNTVISQK